MSFLLSICLYVANKKRTRTLSVFAVMVMRRDIDANLNIGVFKGVNSFFVYLADHYY